MNTPLPTTANAPLSVRAEDEINLLDLFDVVLDSRWLIAAVTVLGLLVGVAYALLATPVYRASTMVQVEESKGGAGTLLGEAASLFDIRSPASAEMQILRSRLVLGQTVENLDLDVEVRPKIPAGRRAMAGTSCKRAIRSRLPDVVGLCERQRVAARRSLRGA